MGNFNLITQYPKLKKLGNGVLSIIDGDNAQFLEGNGEDGSNVIACMERIRIDHASSKGILLSGIERIGSKTRLQEWWLMYDS